jgi:hypothetical protein
MISFVVSQLPGAGSSQKLQDAVLKPGIPVLLLNSKILPTHITSLASFHFCKMEILNPGSLPYGVVVRLKWVNPQVLQVLG